MAAGRTRGRPPTAEGARPHQLLVRLSEGEHAALESLCERLGLTPTEAVRTAILQLAARD